jgi:hypothetical protein
MPFSYGAYLPETLALMYRALASAWLEFEQWGEHPTPADIRSVMAKRIMAEVALGEATVERLKTVALAAANPVTD